MKALFVVSSFILITSLTGCNAKDARISFIEHASVNIVESGYGQLSASANQLSQVAMQCEAAEADYQQIVDELKINWLKTMSSWQYVQWVQFGPIKEDGREWSLQFWPDKRNLVGKKINTLLKANDVINEKSLVRGGVLTQGLSAMEYLLFDRLKKKLESEKVDILNVVRQACLSSIAITQKIKATSQVLLRDWSKYHRKNFSQLENPTSDADVLDAQQALSIVINNVIAAIDVMQNRKLGTPFSLGGNNSAKPELSAEDVKKANSFFLESWRSQSSRSNLRNNIKVLRDLFAHKSFKHLLVEKNQKELELMLNDLIAKLEKVLAVQEIEPSYFERLSLNKLDAANHVKPLYKAMGELKVLVATDLVKVLGIQAGFNANDGDS